METTQRTLLKAMTWQATGLASMSTLGYILTGNLNTAGQFALGSAVIGFMLFIVHEKLWSAVQWGRVRADRD